MLNLTHVCFLSLFLFSQQKSPDPQVDVPIMEEGTIEHD